LGDQDAIRTTLFDIMVSLPKPHLGVSLASFTLRGNATPASLAHKNVGKL